MKKAKTTEEKKRELLKKLEELETYEKIQKDAERVKEEEAAKMIEIERAKEQQRLEAEEQRLKAEKEAEAKRLMENVPSNITTHPPPMDTALRTIGSPFVIPQRSEAPIANAPSQLSREGVGDLDRKLNFIIGITLTDVVVSLLLIILFVTFR